MNIGGTPNSLWETKILPKFIIINTKNSSCEINILGETFFKQYII